MVFYVKFTHKLVPYDNCRYAFDFFYIFWYFISPNNSSLVTQQFRRVIKYLTRHTNRNFIHYFTGKHTHEHSLFLSKMLLIKKNFCKFLPFHYHWWKEKLKRNKAKIKSNFHHYKSEYLVFFLVSFEQNLATTKKTKQNCFFYTVWQWVRKCNFFLYYFLWLVFTQQRTIIEQCIIKKTHTSLNLHLNEN